MRFISLYGYSLWSSLNLPSEHDSSIEQLHPHVLANDRVFGGLRTGRGLNQMQQSPGQSVAIIITERQRKILRLVIRNRRDNPFQ